MRILIIGNIIHISKTKNIIEYENDNNENDNKYDNHYKCTISYLNFVHINKFEK